MNYLEYFLIFTLKPISPGFSASKSYKATQHGCCCDGWGGFAGDLMGLGNGDAIFPKFKNNLFINLMIIRKK